MDGNLGLLVVRANSPKFVPLLSWATCLNIIDSSSIL